MADFGNVLDQLKQERRHLNVQLQQLDEAIHALSKVQADSSRSAGRSTTKRVMSAAARRRISAAQKARWAKFRAKAGKKVA
jgi:predicted  nucleic acid-binding Zn-ribbon protein